MHITDQYTLTNSPKKHVTGVTKNTGSSFTDLLKNNFDQIINNLHTSEQVGINTVSNKSDIHSLMTHFNVTEVNLRILMMINEKLVNAIQDITRMQI